MDRFDLERFVATQEPVWEAVCQEMEAGRKRTHWMWFVFPQIRGLGNTHTARHYAIQSIDEARAFMTHEVLGPRLVGLTKLVLRHESTPARSIFGHPDDLKFRSSMTLFEGVAGDDCFREALQSFFDGARCTVTLDWLKKDHP